MYLLDFGFLHRICGVNGALTGIKEIGDWLWMW